MFEHLFNNINEDTILLTPNQRLAATLRKRYNQSQSQQQCWLTPVILAATSWINLLWNEYQTNTFAQTPHLLNSLQVDYLWETIIQQSAYHEPLLQISATANTARSAWNLICQYQLNLSHPLFHASEDYRTMHDWAVNLKKIYADSNYTDAAQLPDYLAKLINENAIAVYRKIVLIGFIEISPQLTALLNACQQQGAEIIFMSLQAAENNTQRIKLADKDNELTTMARWAKKMYENNPTATIGCVIPNLNHVRDRVINIFSSVFAKETTYQTTSNESPFNISAGKPLGHYPVIKAALRILSLYQSMVSIEFFSQLLHSPFIGEGESERMRRAVFDSKLRRRNANSIVINSLIPDLEAAVPKLAKRLNKTLELIDQNDKTLGQWCALFSEILKMMGWPGERSLNSEEYQTVETWLQLLNNIHMLDLVAKPMSIANAWHLLNKISNKQPFQAQTPETPIQILGLLEAASIPFDHVWVAGMDDISWPPKPSPNPFIPKQLQREFQLPHANTERELDFCTRLTEQFMQCNKTVIFSYAESDDKLKLHVSPLIKNIAEVTSDDLALPDYKNPIERVYQSKAIETLVDNHGPAIATQLDIQGGVDVLKQQALCPFKSFAMHRLHARELDSPTPGLRPQDRGNIVHKSLELVWQQIGSQAALLHLTPPELQQIIYQCIQQAVTQSLWNYEHRTHYTQLEVERIYKIIDQWLQHEKNRPPFRVFMNEARQCIQLANLSLTVRIDRVDELTDQHYLVIDYKTSQNYDVNSWFGDRPDEPQLPLYALLDSVNTIGITFATLTAGNTYFDGISKYTLDIDGINPIDNVKKADANNWSKQIDQWHSTLLRLATDFCTGRADVDPKENEQTCNRCGIKPLCRINEIRSA